MFSLSGVEERVHIIIHLANTEKENERSTTAISLVKLGYDESRLAPHKNFLKSCDP